ncbi:hypothetical protein JVU11DRAFT_5897 [Chiua virens]|nr:hypothetical protein JVU11DRAFT_5897 [Chiua virens]
MLYDDTPRLLGDVLSHNALFTTPLTDPTPSTSSDPGTLSTAQSMYAEERSTSEAVQKRPILLPHHSAPLPPPFRVTTDRGLRLSPSIIARQPMPLLNLPSLPPAPPVPDSPPKRKIPLRHIPSLLRHGQSNLGCQADHENEAPEDSDSDEGEGEEGDDDEEHAGALSIHQSDDEDEDPPSAGPSGTQGSKSAQKQRAREDDEFPSASLGHVSPDSPHSGSAGPNLADLFCSKTYVQTIHFAPSSTSESLATYPFSPGIPNSEDVNQRRVLDPDLPIPGARLESKPSLYRVASRSMINLGPTRRVDRNLHRLKSREDMVRSNAASVAETHSDTEESDTEAVIGRLLRRTSMPSFHPTSDPPPYPTFDPYRKENYAALRGDEGRERLPSYNNSLYLIAIMPRKMEFSSPGVQAKDRKWRRVVCELEGTIFRVYKCPPGASGAGVLGDWWEKRVGVGDVATPNPPRTHKKEEPSEMPMKAGVDEPTLAVTPGASSVRSISVSSGTRDWRRRESQSSMATQSTMMSTPRPAKRISSASFLSPFRSSSSTRPEGSASDALLRSNSRDLELLPVDVHESRTSLSHESSGRATPAAAASHPRLASRLGFLPVAASRAHLLHAEVLKPPESNLLRAYTLQHAESGLGNDYLKRKNVIRVRLEGEQFLLQAPDVPAVVEWIEGLHAGGNIALDIDQRPMPRGPMFPRRRRRRTRRVESEGTSGSGQQQETAVLA